MPTLPSLVPACPGRPVSRAPRATRSDTALVLSRGFGSTNTALVIRV
jgi:hypothetical protein